MERPIVNHSTRRQFLGAATAGLTVAGASSFTAFQAAQAHEQPAKPTSGDLGTNARVTSDQVVFLNDTHIGEQHGPDHLHPTNLTKAVEAILALPKNPAAVIINGDLAMSVGTAGDYQAFAKRIAPLVESGQNLHLTLGNHDNREEFRRAFPHLASASRLKEYRHNGVIELSHVRLVLLDSLKETPAAPGRLGEDQIDWLLDTVDAQREKPTVIVAHHNPRLGGDPIHYPGGIEDTEQFWPELLKRLQFKAHIHGHVHDWTLGLHHGAHVVNLMASAMVADNTVCTNGWTFAEFLPTGMALTLRTFLKDHPWDGERKWLYWRQPKVVTKK